MYHISRHYIGDNPVFTPRIPVSQHVSEIEMPARICASQSIEGCWEGIRCCHDLISEMIKIPTTGYYFFIYKFDDASNFSASEVFDAEKTGEFISTSPSKATLVSAFYVNKYKLNYSIDSAQQASLEEAIEAYNDWQKEDLLNAEQAVLEMSWEA